MDTHCLPTGAIGTGQITVPNVSSAQVTAYMPAGAARGVVVCMHGLSDFLYPIPSEIGTINSSGFLANDYTPQFRTSLVADSWIVLPVPYPEDYSSNFGVLAIQNDLMNDSGHGSRYLNTSLLWWDHVVIYCNKTFGQGVPIVPFGTSWGAWHTLQIAINRQSTIVAYCAQVPATILHNVNPGFTAPGVFTNLTTSGLDIGPTALNAVTIPGVIGYGTNDEALGWTATTAASGSSGTAVSSFTGSGTLHVASSANLTIGPLVTITGLTGGTGSAVISFTGTGTGTLTGCTTVSGSGTIGTGNPVTQSYVDALISNQQAANPSHQMIRYSTNDTHEFTSADATYYTGTFFASDVDPSYPPAFS